MARFYKRHIFIETLRAVMITTLFYDVFCDLVAAVTNVTVMQLVVLSVVIN
jgi:hypothetical protein